MKRILFIVFLICSLSGNSQTQAEMNEQAIASFQESEDRLKSIYQQILKGYKSDSIFIENLKASQQLWTQWRAAELKMKYPERDGNYYGSIHPVCRASFLQELTEDRIGTLSAWVTGIYEGDACSGSVKVR